MSKYGEIPEEYQGDDAFAALHVSTEDVADDELPTEEAPVELEEDDEDEEEEELAPATSRKSGPKFMGKHSLKHDSIFKGRKIAPLNPDDYDPIYDGRSTDKMAVDPGSVFHQEATDPEEYARSKQLKERVYELVTTKTGVNLKANRRKPSRADFNRYFRMLETELRAEGFSKAQLFSELAHYFSDNLFNMFKLLSPDIGTEIVRELRQNANMQPLDDIDFLV